MDIHEVKNGEFSFIHSNSEWVHYFRLFTAQQYFTASALWLIITIRIRRLFSILFSISRDCIHATFLKDNKFPDYVPIGNAFNFSKWLFSAMYAVLCSSFPLIWIDIGPFTILTPSQTRLRFLLTMGFAYSLTIQMIFPVLWME